MFFREWMRMRKFYSIHAVRMDKKQGSKKIRKHQCQYKVNGNMLKFVSHFQMQRNKKKSTL